MKLESFIKSFSSQISLESNEKRKALEKRVKKFETLTLKFVTLKTLMTTTNT